MEHAIVYVCEGTCKGVSKYMKSCGAASCDRHGQPLAARVQCDACAQAAERDNGAHACAKCATA